MGKKEKKKKGPSCLVLLLQIDSFDITITSHVGVRLLSALLNYNLIIIKSDNK